jgi:large subunit ribosomal protein L31
MKAQIHPKWMDATVKCACGNTFTVGSTMPSINVDICSACHPYFTGQMKYIDTAGRVDAFKAKMAHANANALSKADRRRQKRERRFSEEFSRPDTFAQFKKQLKKKS